MQNNVSALGGVTYNLPRGAISPLHPGSNSMTVNMVTSARCIIPLLLRGDRSCRIRVRLLERRPDGKGIRHQLDIREGLTEVRGRVEFGPLKTKGSRRTVSIPKFVADELAAHMSRYMRAPAEDTHGTDLVFRSAEGKPIRRTNFVRRAWGDAVKAAKLTPPPTPYDLRHTGAALAIENGAHPKAIQSRMGHTSITTTLNVYGHLFEGMDDELAERMHNTYQQAGADPS